MSHTDKISIDNLQIADFHRLSCILKDRDAFLTRYLDKTLLSLLTDDCKDHIHQAVKQAFQNQKIKLIQENTGQTMVPTGTNVEITSDVGQYKAGDILIVDDVTVFDEDTFGQGWFLYQLVKKNGNEKTLPISLYRNEFHVLASDENELRGLSQ